MWLSKVPSLSKAPVRTVIQSARLCEAEPFAYVSELLTKLAEYHDMTAEGEAFLRELLPAAWLTRNPEKRLALGR
jgi:hypothetical protein